MVQLKTTKDNNKLTFHIDGKLTLVHKSEFNEYIKENVFTQTGILGIDLSLLEYIDSSGIGDLIKLKMEATKTFDEVYVFGVEGVVEKVFRIAGLTSVFQVIAKDEFQNL